ncbi:MAG: metal-dependent transcriptional regulator [Eubacterium sp.]|nr:metal-dependent transcriptional regulator [Eubacterium sp.]
MKSNESSEDYLETILILSERQEHVRSVDIANEMGFKKPSVSVAMKNLRNNGHITVDEDGFITLTEKGTAIARRTYERHQFFTDYLIKIGVDPTVAADDACRLEHVISEESFDALKKHLK